MGEKMVFLYQNVSVPLTRVQNMELAALPKNQNKMYAFTLNDGSIVCGSVFDNNKANSALSVQGGPNYGGPTLSYSNITGFFEIKKNGAYEITTIDGWKINGVVWSTENSELKVIGKAQSKYDMIESPSSIEKSVISRAAATIPGCNIERIAPVAEIKFTKQSASEFRK
jgi:hypothetical protein